MPAFPIGPVRNRFVSRPLLHQMSGKDLIAVWVCDIPPTSTFFLYQLDPGTEPE